MDLFPHQQKGVDFLSASEGTKGLFYGMGTGKTLTSIYAARSVGVDRMVVIGPPISLPMWAATCEEHMKDLPGDAAVQLLATGATKIKAGMTVLVVSYAIAAKRATELRNWLGEGVAPVLICDESHALKSVTAKRTKAILGRGGLASGAGYVWMLTGTPITRWNDDMYPFLCRADLSGMKEICGGVSPEKFQLRYTVRQKRKFAGARFATDTVVGNRNTNELADWVYGKGLAIRVDLEEVFRDMPPITHNRYAIAVDADAQLKAELKAMDKMSLGEIEERLQSSDPEVSLSRVRRMLGVGKVKAAAAEIVERIESGVSVLVGAWHTEVIDELAAALRAKKLRVGVIDGRTSGARKQQVQDDWNAGKLDAVIGQLASMAVSLNLQQGGHHIVVVEEDWSPEIMRQFYARLWRYGQEKHVHVDTLVTTTKLDQAVARISAAKSRGIEKMNEIGNHANS